MAPSAKRRPIRARASAASSTARSSAPQPKLTNDTALDDASWRLNKQDKRMLKHSALLHRVREAGICKQTVKKRRRPAKKLAAAEGLDELRDALLEMNSADEGGSDGWEGLSDVEGVGGEGVIERKKKRTRREAEGKMGMRSLKMRPGASKRKELLHRREVERFAKNLAQMAGGEGKQLGGGGEKSGVGIGEGQQAAGGDQGAKWAALRNFISATVERDPAFAVR